YEPGQIVGPHAREAAAKAPDRRAQSVYDDCVCHFATLLDDATAVEAQPLRRRSAVRDRAVGRDLERAAERNSVRVDDGVRLFARPRAEQRAQLLPVALFVVTVDGELERADAGEAIRRAPVLRKLDPMAPQPAGARRDPNDD